MPRIETVLGDLTTEDTDAVVNAAHESLLGGGGVDGALHAAAGPALLAACRELRATRYPDGLPTGEAVATSAGALRAHHVIHTVGPRHWEHPDGGAELLRSCHLRSLEEADRLGDQSIAFPAISCGVFGWSAAEAAPVAVAAVRDYGVDHPESGIEIVRFVLFSAAVYDAFAAAVAATA
jgi:O-acetyl-ADP-ribose deacetylase (regulator of RNase III)